MSPQPDSSSDVLPQGALCALHPTAPAAALCTRCGSYACPTCVRVGEDGLSYCFSCVSKVTVLASRGARFSANLVDKALGSNTGGGIIMGLSALYVPVVLGYQLYRASETGQNRPLRLEPQSSYQSAGGLAGLMMQKAAPVGSMITAMRP